MEIVSSSDNQRKVRVSRPPICNARFAGSIDGGRSSGKRLSVSVERVPLLAATSPVTLHHPPFPAQSLSSARSSATVFLSLFLPFPTLREPSSPLGFFGFFVKRVVPTETRATTDDDDGDDGAPSRGATLYAETSRTLLHNYIPLPSPTSPPRRWSPHLHTMDPPGW